MRNQLDRRDGVQLRTREAVEDEGGERRFRKQREKERRHRATRQGVLTDNENAAGPLELFSIAVSLRRPRSKFLRTQGFPVFDLSMIKEFVIVPAGRYLVR